MSELHMFSPMPPDRNGVADYAAALLPMLNRWYEVSVHDGRQAGAEPPDGARLLHQLGNSAGHVFVLRAMRRHPGVAVLHDLTLAVPSRLAETSESPSLRAALQERSPGLAATLGREWLEHGGQAGAAAAVFDLVAHALRGSRAVVVHSRHAQRRLREFDPALAARSAVIPHLAVKAPSDRAAARAALGLPSGRTVLLTAGFPSRAKRLEWVAEAMAEVARRRGDVLWVHAGEGDASAIAPELAAAGRLRVTGYLSEADLAAWIAAADAMVNLRAPSVGESSGVLARALAAGRCVLVSDVAAYAELPRDAVLHLPALAPQRGLAEAILAIARDRALAEAVGERARRYARAVLSPEAVGRAYRAVIEDFRAAPPLRRVSPAELAADRDLAEASMPLASPGLSSGAPPRVLVVSPMVPWPPRAGNAARLRALGLELAARGQPLELCCPLPPQGASPGADPRQMAVLEREWAAVHPMPWQPRPVPSLADRWALDDWCPPKTVEAVAALHRARRYDAVVASYTWMSAVLEAVPGALRLLDTHDLVGGRAAAATAAGLLPSWYWTGEAEEAEGLGRADLVIGIQPEESRVLRRRGGRPVLTVGHAMPARLLERALPAGAWPFGMLASGNVWNIQAAAALDRALAESPEVAWLLAGEARLPGPFRSAGTRLGPVGEPEEFYDLVACAVNPMEGGTGLKIKTVEAIGYGRPVIGTRHAFAGLRPEHPAHRAADAAEVAGWMREMTLSDTLAPELLDASRVLALRWRAEVDEGLDALVAALRGNAVAAAA
ncbi:glycosyltransferase [Roseomonas elaeocarpi]|uniref:Glycosyltransferase n=1 Tax=Roseomonas elaeocarpi TaxID=907779 RepID=A0ABV6JQW6_9PROT